MRVPHSPDQKAAVLAQFEANGWNVSLTSQETGIPQRTLYHWRWQKWQQLQRQTPSPSAAANFATGYNFGNEISPPLHVMEQGPGGEDITMRGPGGEDNSPESDIAALSNLRRHLLDELVTMSADLERGLKMTSPYQKVLILTQLLDRLMKL